MAEYGLTEDEATTFITQGVNFGMTQLVDGNWGVHGIVSKENFEAMSTEETSDALAKHGWCWYNGMAAFLVFSFAILL